MKAKPVADHDDLRLEKSGKNVAREARAAEAKVSPATMATSRGTVRFCRPPPYQESSDHPRRR